MAKPLGVALDMIANSIASDLLDALRKISIQADAGLGATALYRRRLKKCGELAHAALQKWEAEHG